MDKKEDIKFIKNKLLNLKNKKINDNGFKRLEKYSQKDEISFLNIKKINEENENKYNIKPENLETEKKENKSKDFNQSKKEIINEIKEEEELLDISEDLNNNIKEEEDESFSISLNENSFIDDESKKNNEKINSKIKKKKYINYKKGNKRTILKRKKYYVYQLLQRWWYALPNWPPEDLDVSDKLKENNLRLVEEKNWKKEVDINSDNFTKCLELPGYKYVYLSKDGKIYDFRPEKDKPSFNNLMKLDDIELHQYLVNALKNQLEELEKRNYKSEKLLRENIRNQYKIAKLNLKHIKS